MKITSKSKYALKIMIDLALFPKNSLRQRSDIAKKQGVPIQYMGQILKKLHENKLVVSKRGPSGGLKLNLPLEKITLWMIITAVENDILPVKCLDKNSHCTLMSDCMTKDIWSEILDADGFDAFLEKKNIFDPETAEKLYHFIYSRGDTLDYFEAYEGFRGRKPTTDALLRNRGLN